MAPKIFWGPNGPGVVTQALSLTTKTLNLMSDWCGSAKTEPRA